MFRYRKNDQMMNLSFSHVVSIFQVEQITAEYKNLALQYHPDKNAGNKEAEEKFQKLKEAKEILCDPEKRCNYDKWRNSGIAISYKQWVSMKDHVHQVNILIIFNFFHFKDIT